MKRRERSCSHPCIARCPAIYYRLLNVYRALASWKSCDEELELESWRKFQKEAVKNIAFKTTIRVFSAAKKIFPNPSSKLNRNLCFRASVASKSYKKKSLLIQQALFYTAMYVLCHNGAIQKDRDILS